MCRGDRGAAARPEGWAGLGRLSLRADGRLPGAASTPAAQQVWGL